jgi:hypothetical protein
VSRGRGGGAGAGSEQWGWAGEGGGPYSPLIALLPRCPTTCSLASSFRRPGPRRARYCSPRGKVKPRNICRNAWSCRFDCREPAESNRYHQQLPNNPPPRLFQRASAASAEELSSGMITVEVGTRRRFIFDSVTKRPPALVTNATSSCGARGQRAGARPAIPARAPPSPDTAPRASTPRRGNAPWAGGCLQRMRTGGACPQPNPGPQTPRRALKPSFPFNLPGIFFVSTCFSRLDDFPKPFFCV